MVRRDLISASLSAIVGLNYRIRLQMQFRTLATLKSKTMLSGDGKRGKMAMNVSAILQLLKGKAGKIILVVIMYSVFKLSFPYIVNLYYDTTIPFVFKPVYDTVFFFKNESEVKAFLRKGSRLFFLTSERESQPVDLSSKIDIALLDSIFIVYNDPKSHYRGLATLSGKDIIPPDRFSYVHAPFDDSKGIVKIDFEISESFSEYAVIDVNSNIIKTLPDDIYVFDGFHEGLAMAASKEGTGFINTEGEWAIEPQFDSLKNFMNGYAAAAKSVGKDDEGREILRWGLIDRQGRVVIDFKYADIGNYGGQGLIAFAAEYVRIELTRGNHIFPMEKNLYGYMDLDENVVVEPQFIEASEFREGIASVTPMPKDEWMLRERNSLKWPWQYIDVEGNILLELKYDGFYDEVDRTEDYIAVINKNTGKTGLINNPKHSER